MFTAACTALLPPALKGVPITHVATIDSTNRQAERWLAVGQAPPFLLVAAAQSAGVGRRGHHFASPAAAGLYMTYAFPAPAAGTMPLVTPAAGVALQAAITEVLNRTTAIKWVNDLLLDGRKVAGILAESVPAPQASVILGVGLNLAPAARQAEAGAVPIGTVLAASPTSDVRPALVAAWLVHFTALLAAPQRIMPAYRQHAAWVGQPVQWTSGAERQRGRLTGFADDGALQLTTATGTATHHTGSIRLAEATN